MDEIRGTPRAANQNLFLGGNNSNDGTMVYQILRGIGYGQGDAIEKMHELIDENIADLSHPAMAGVIQENLGFREKGLSRQFHYSPERLQNMHAEIERRKVNEKRTGNVNNETGDGGGTGVDQKDVAEGESGVQESTGHPPGGEEGKIANAKDTEKHDTGPDNGQNDRGRQAADTRGEGGGSAGTSESLWKEEVANAEKETNQPNLRNRPVVEQNGETTAARDSGESEAAATKPAETEEGIVSEEKIKKTAQEPPEITPNDKQQAKNDAMVKGIAGMIKSGTTRVNATQAETAAKAARAGYEIIKSGGDVPGPRNGLISPDGKYTIDTKNNHEEFRDAVGITEDEQFDQGWVRKAGPEAFQFGALKSPHSPAVNEVERQIIVGAQDGPIFVAGDDFTLDTTKDEIIRKGLGTLINRAQRQGKK